MAAERLMTDRQGTAWLAHCATADQQRNQAQSNVTH